MGIAAKNSNTAEINESDIGNVSFCRFIIDNVPTAIFTVNPELRITSFNLWAEKVTGYTSVEAIGNYCGDILRGGMCGSNCPLRTVLSGNNPVSLLMTTIHNKQGEGIPVRMNTAGLYANDGKLLGGVESFQDISAIKRLEREKDNLISILAHDMKSSLTLIGGFLFRVLRMGKDIDKQKQQKYLHIAEDEVRQLETMINDFLEFSRLQLGRLQLNIAPASLDKLLIEVFEAYQVKASQHKIALHLETVDVLPFINIDKNRIRRVFANLLDNALKYSNENGNIAISTHEGDREISVKITDQGIGIDPKDIPYVFETFHRGKGVGGKPGFGLGLAGVKAIVESHGGRVSVESEVGKGSVFTVVLPKPESPIQIAWSK
jgi:two-component system phosphate regulon sensor histidine kinase PhoR